MTPEQRARTEEWVARFQEAEARILQKTHKNERIRVALLDSIRSMIDDLRQQVADDAQGTGVSDGNAPYG